MLVSFQAYLIVVGKVTHGRVEESTTDTEEHPGVDQQTHPKGNRDVERRGRVEACLRAIYVDYRRIARDNVGQLSSGKCEKEKCGRADELPNNRYDICLMDE